MARSHLRGNQHLHRLTDELLARVAEQLLALGIRHPDDALLIHDHQPVRRELQHAAEELLGLAQAMLAGPDVLQELARPDVAQEDLELERQHGGRFLEQRALLLRQRAE